MTLEPIIHYLETHYPESTAVPSDIGKIGLAVGSLKEPLKKILLALILLLKWWMKQLL
jgi:putative NIF3 family GTP cyclohydrolase 1 type 2